MLVRTQEEAISTCSLTIHGGMVEACSVLRETKLSYSFQNCWLSSLSSLMMLTGPSANTN